MLFVASLIIANTVAVKIISIGSLTIPAGILCFPLAYIINDVLVEVYGFERTKKVIWWGFIALAFMSIVYYLSNILPAAPFWDGQDAFDRLFSFIPRIGIASFVAYLIGTFLNSMVMSKLKKRMNGKHLWVRTIGSTIIGEGVDSVVFNMIAFYGVFPDANLWAIIGTGFALKVLYEIIATPLTYFVIARVKKLESEDKYDHGVSYNPF
jgi:uncharacterized integral membrane protein (TIGR00697 family)